MAGGGSAPQIGNPAQGPITFTGIQPQLQQGYNFQTQNFNQFAQNQPLLSNVQPLINQASTGAEGFFNQLFGGTGISQGISNAQSEINTGGLATPQQARDTNQATLANASASGQAFSPSTLGQQAINEDQARQQRVNTAYGQLGSAQGLESGGLNQLLGAAQGGVGALQGEVGAFSGLTNPILSFLSNMFGQNTQAQIAQLQASTQSQLANQAKSGGAASSGIGAIGSIAAAALPLLAASDERLKDDIRDTGLTTHDGVPMKTFSYKTRPGRVYLGVLAQDAERVAPDAVYEELLSGLKFVDSARFPMIALGDKAA